MSSTSGWSNGTPTPITFECLPCKQWIHKSKYQAHLDEKHGGLEPHCNYMARTRALTTLSLPRSKDENGGAESTAAQSVGAKSGGSAGGKSVKSDVAESGSVGSAGRSGKDKADAGDKGGAGYGGTCKSASAATAYCQVCKTEVLEAHFEVHTKMHEFGAVGHVEPPKTTNTVASTCAACGEVVEGQKWYEHIKQRHSG